MRGLSLHHAPPLLALGVVHRNATLAALNEHHQINHDRCEHQNAQQDQNADLALARLLQRLANRRRQPCDNTGEDEQGDAVTNASLGNLLTQPHHEYRTRHQRRHGGDVKAESSRVGQALVRKTHGHARALNQCQNHREVSGPLGNLAATRFTLFLQLL